MLARTTGEEYEDDEGESEGVGRRPTDLREFLYGQPRVLGAGIPLVSSDFRQSRCPQLASYYPPMLGMNSPLSSLMSFFLNQAQPDSLTLARISSVRISEPVMLDILTHIRIFQIQI